MSSDASKIATVLRACSEVSLEGLGLVVPVKRQLGVQFDVTGDGVGFNQAVRKLKGEEDFALGGNNLALSKV